MNANTGVNHATEEDGVVRVAGADRGTCVAPVRLLIQSVRQPGRGDQRPKLAGAKTPEDTIAAANAQSSALSRLLAIAENYPQLKANEQFNRLMDELAGTENRIAVERKRYNDNVQAYDTLRRQFPSNITATLFGFKEHPYFQAPPEAKAVPKVEFGK